MWISAHVMGCVADESKLAKAGSFASWLGGEEQLKQPVSDLGRDAGPVVSHSDLHRVAQFRVETFSVGSKSDFTSIRRRWPTV